MTMEELNSSDDKEKSLYLIQIRYLEEQLEGCQLTCEELQRQNDDLVSQYNALEKEEKEKADHLKRSVAASEKRLEELFEQLETEQQAAEQAEKALQEQRRCQKEVLQESINQLQAINDMQAATLEEQGQQLARMKQQQTCDLNSKEIQLALKKEEHKSAIHNLKLVLESEKAKSFQSFEENLEKGVLSKVSEVLEERPDHSKRQKQLQLMQNKGTTLQEEIDALQICEADILCCKCDLQKRIIEESKLRVRLKKKVKQEKKKLNQLLEERKESYNTQQTIQARIAALSQRLASASDACQKKSEVIRQLEEERQKEEMRCRRLDGVRRDAAIILTHILSGKEKESETEWMTQRLLEILQSCKLKGTQLTFVDSP